MWIEMHSKGQFLIRYPVAEYDDINVEGMNLQQRVEVRERLVTMFLDKFNNENATLLLHFKEVEKFVVFSSVEKPNLEPNYLYNGEPL
jgi:hypothetical protein